MNGGRVVDIPPKRASRLQQMFEGSSRFISAQPVETIGESHGAPAPVGRVFVGFTVALALAYLSARIELWRNVEVSPGGVTQLGVVATTTFALATLAVLYRAITSGSPRLAPIAAFLLLPGTIWCWVALVEDSTVGSTESTIAVLLAATVAVVLLGQGLRQARWLGVFCGLGAVGLTTLASLVHYSPEARFTLSTAVMASLSGLACLYGTVVEIELDGRRSLEELVTAKRRIEADIASTEDLLHDLRSGLLAIEAAMISLDDEVSEPLRSETARLRKLTAKNRRQPVEFDLVPGIRNMVKTRRSSGMVIDLRAPTSARTVGEESEVMAIVDNLVSNALRHGAEPVQISIEDRAERLYVRITDSGRLQHPVDSSAMFDRGFTSHEEGDGIGLDRARVLAELHHGSLTYQPGVDGETVFVLTLPSSDSNRESCGGPQLRWSAVVGP